MILTLGPISEICKFLPAFEAYTLFIRLHPKTNKIIKQFPDICKCADILYDLIITKKYTIQHASLAIAVELVRQENKKQQPSHYYIQSEFDEKYSEYATYIKRMSTSQKSNLHTIKKKTCVLSVKIFDYINQNTRLYHHTNDTK